MINDTVKETSAQLLAFVHTHKSASAWQLKVHFRLRSSLLYLSLGFLAAEGKIKLEENGTDYIITLL